MEDYILGNKEAWEEAFEMRDASWGADIVECVQKEDYAFFYPEMKEVLRKVDFKGKTVGQFCCNNGRELLALVKSAGAAKGIGFDIAENQVAFANEKAKELGLPCEFIATNVLEIGEAYREQFDVVIITIGALCWFKDLKAYFEVVSKCMKKNGLIMINEQHPFTNMIAAEGEPEYDSAHPLSCVFSYFEHEWTGNGGMYYMTKKSYESKTFTDYTHSVSEIISAMCMNHIAVTGMQELDYDISGGFSAIDHKGFPLSMVIEGKKMI